MPASEGAESMTALPPIPTPLVSVTGPVTAPFEIPSAMTDAGDRWTVTLAGAAAVETSAPLTSSPSTIAAQAIAARNQLTDDPADGRQPTRCPIRRNTPPRAETSQEYATLNLRSTPDAKVPLTRPGASPRRSLRRASAEG